MNAMRISKPLLIFIRNLIEYSEAKALFDAADPAQTPASWAHDAPLDDCNTVQNVVKSIKTSVHKEKGNGTDL